MASLVGVTPARRLWGGEMIEEGIRSGPGYNGVGGLHQRKICDITEYEK